MDLHRTLVANLKKINQGRKKAKKKKIYPQMSNLICLALIGGARQELEPGSFHRAVPSADAQASHKSLTRSLA
jgi:hypothetical protein